VRNPKDPFNLERFVAAQETFYPAALSELRDGQKETHWMWFIFPQLEGLGGSFMAKRYAIRSKEEAAAYLKHPLLSEHLVKCAEALMLIQDKSAEEVMGFPDDLKLRSSMTLFASVSEPGSIFHRVVEKYFKGEFDPRTLDLLAHQKS